MTVETDWTTLGGFRYVKRTFTAWHPQAGRPCPFVFDTTSPGENNNGGNIVEFSMDEDRAILSDRAWAIGANSMATFVSSDTLVGQGIPLGFALSFTDITTQASLGEKATNKLTPSTVLPPKLLVLADGDPGLGDLRSATASPSTSTPRQICRSATTARSASSVGR